MRKFGKKVKFLLRLAYLSIFPALIEYRHAHADRRANVRRVIRLVRPDYQPANTAFHNPCFASAQPRQHALRAKRK